MAAENQTSIFEFLLWGLSEQPEQRHILFHLFLWMYVVTVAGNLLIVLAIGTDARLHTPMYFFLTSLSCADILFTSTTVPKALVNIQTQSKLISYAGCLAQLYFFLTFGDMDIFLLTTMAFNLCVAICHPLHYTMVTSLSAAPSWGLPAHGAPSFHNSHLSHILSFLLYNVIPDLFCHLGPR